MIRFTKQRRRSSIVGTAIAVGALATLVGCSSGAPQPVETAPEPGADSWDAVVEAAKAEGQLRIFGVSVPETNEALEAAFEAKYPEIDVQIERGNVAETESRLESEAKANARQIDLTLLTDIPWFIANSDLLAPITSPRAAEAPFSDLIGESGKDIVMYYIPYGIAYNTDLVTDPIDSYEDLLRPEFQGRLGVQGPTSAVTLHRYVVLDDALDNRFVEGLAAQDAMAFPSVVPILESLIAGEISATPDAINSAVKAEKEGAPIKVVFPDPIPALATAGAAIANSPNPNAAQLMLDFMMSREGQEAMVVWDTSPLDGISKSIGNAKDFVVVDGLLPEEQSAAFRSRWDEAFGVR